MILFLEEIGFYTVVHNVYKEREELRNDTEEGFRRGKNLA